MAQEMTYDQAAGGRPAARKPSIWSALPSWEKSWPGLLAMAIIAILCGLPGVDFPFTIDTLLRYFDSVLPPIYGKGLFVDLLHFNYVVTCLVAGIVIRNVIGVPKSWEPGLTYSGCLHERGDHHARVPVCAARPGEAGRPSASSS